MRIGIAANTGWYLHNFRLSLMRALRESGHRAVAVSPYDEYVERIADEGFDHIELRLDAAGVNPWYEIHTVRRLRRLLVDARFDALFTYTPKVNIYFGLAAKGLGLPHIPNVSGLGRMFIDRNWLTPLVAGLYRRAFASAVTVMFQNDDDHREFVGQGLVRSDRTTRVPGSGVDLRRFVPAPGRPQGASPVFLFIGRMLRDKGVEELIAAARHIKAMDASVTFRLLGPIGSSNPTAIPRRDIEAWVAEGLVDYLGVTDDVRPHIADADCVVLPSYREGVPRALLEAAAMARPCIASDVPGCRDAVVHERTGLLCKVRDPDSLAEALRRLLAMTASQREALGRAGRSLVEARFDERIVIERYLDLAARIRDRTAPVSRRAA